MREMRLKYRSEADGVNGRGDGERRDEDMNAFVTVSLHLSNDVTPGVTAPDSGTPSHNVSPYNNRTTCFEH